MVTSCMAVGPAGLRSAVVSPSPAMTCDHWPRARACKTAGSWTAVADLDAVRDDLARTVHRAPEPARISVWISQHN